MFLFANAQGDLAAKVVFVVLSLGMCIFGICVAYKFLTDAGFRKDMIQREREKHERRKETISQAAALAKMWLRK
jgi:hypothetical protein